MSWLVGPTGLSRLTTPSIGAVELTLALVEHAGHRLRERRVDRAAGRAGGKAEAVKVANGEICAKRC